MSILISDILLLQLGFVEVTGFSACGQNDDLQKKDKSYNVKIHFSEDKQTILSSVS